MRFSTPYALAASMLVSHTVAVHAGHRHQHKRDLVIVTENEEVYETVLDIIIEDASGNAYSTIESIVYSTADSGVASSAPVAAVSTAVAATTEVAAAATTTAAALAIAAVDAVSSVAAVSTSEAASSTYVAPSSSASSTTLATSYASSSPSPYSSSAAASSSVYSSAAAAASSSVYSSSAASSSAASSSSTYSSSAAASSTYSSSAVASSTSSASSSTSTGARGLSYNDAALTVAFESSSEVTWAYNWAQTAGGLSSHFEFVPMLWSLADDATATWDASVSTALAAGTTHLLAFNEPDLAAESDITAADAAAGYKTYMNPYSGSAKLGAPAVTNGASPGGLNWLKDFLNDCNNECTIDFVPIHWYDSATNYVYFKEYVEEAYIAAGNRTLWITEFGATGTTEEQNTFLETVMPWLDSVDYVERYSYFMCADGSLVDGSSLSVLGSTFSSYVSDLISTLISAL